MFNTVVFGGLVVVAIAQALAGGPITPVTTPPVPVTPLVTAAEAPPAAAATASSATASPAAPAAPSASAAGSATSVEKVLHDKWLKATPQERVRIAEEIGELGARRYADAKGWKPLLDGTKKALSQGVDQVYETADGMIRVIEAKGGTSALGKGYGYQQGSSEWAVKAAERVLKSSKATAAERQAAQRILKAASEGKLIVDVVRTEHVLGVPTRAICEQSTAVTAEARSMAKTVLEAIKQEAGAGLKSSSKVLSEVDDVARGAARGLQTESKAASEAAERVVARGLESSIDDVGGAAAGKLLPKLGKAAGPAAVALDVGIRAYDASKVEEQYKRGEISSRERAELHAANAGGFVGGWAGAYAGGQAAAVVAAPVAAATGPFAPLVEGGAVVVGALVGYVTGDAVGQAAGKAVVDQCR